MHSASLCACLAQGPYGLLKCKKMVKSEGPVACMPFENYLLSQDPQLNDKILIYTPDGKCVDYFVTEPPNVLEEGLRTGNVVLMA